MSKIRPLHLVFVAAFLGLGAFTISRFQPHLLQRPAEAADNGPAQGRRAATAQERKAAVRSVQGQLLAFQKDRFDEAIGYQSRSLRQHFSSPKFFRQMIQAHYPQFVHFQEVEFGAAQASQDGRFLDLPVTLHGAGGVLTEAHYDLVREDGAYHVDGVMTGPAARPRAPRA